MSFMRTLATVAVGFAAAKGIDKYKEMGGMAGLQKMMDASGQGGGAAGLPGMGDLQKMADGMGLGGLMGGAGGGQNPLQALMGGMTGGTQAAGAAGLGGLMAAMQGAASASGQQADQMLGAMFEGTPAGDAMEENAKLMIRAMIQAAKADGEIDAEEQSKILDQLGEVSPEERAFVEQQLAAPLDIEGLARDTSEAIKAQIYATSLMAIHVDNRAEAAYLAQLSQALGLPKDVRDRMHAAMGIAPLPA